MKKILLSILLVCICSLSCSKKNEKITSVSQLNGKRICVLPGSAADVAARGMFPRATFIEMAGSEDAALAVKTGKADAFIYDKSVLLKILGKNPDMVILDERISKLELAIAMNKSNLQLVEKINIALDKLKKTDILDSLREKWVDAEYTIIPSLPAVKTDGKNGTLKMGTCAIFEPYAFKSDGKFTGFDIELSILLSELLDMKFEITEMAFEELIPALQSGKIDFALSDFTVTEERKKLISYSESYIQNDISVLVNSR